MRPVNHLELQAIDWGLSVDDQSVYDPTWDGRQKCSLIDADGEVFAVVDSRVAEAFCILLNRAYVEMVDRPNDLLPETIASFGQLGAPIQEGVDASSHPRAQVWLNGVQQRCVMSAEPGQQGYVIRIAQHRNGGDLFRDGRVMIERVVGRVEIFTDEPYRYQPG